MLMKISCHEFWGGMWQFFPDTRNIYSHIPIANNTPTGGSKQFQTTLK